MDTKIITNFNPNLTRIMNGDMASGSARYDTTHGVSPFQKPQVLCFMEKARDIRKGIITDLIVASCSNANGKITNIFSIGSAARLYKIQVNDTATKNPDFDTPTLLNTLVIYTIALATGFNVGDNVTSSSGGVGTISDIIGTTLLINITSGTFNVGDSITDTTTSNTTTITAESNPTFTNGGSIVIYSGYLFIGFDAGVIKTDLAGLNPKFIGNSWTQNTPRPMKVFIGFLYVGNGNNIAEISTGFIVTTYSKLSPAPGANDVVDIDVSPDGSYLILTQPQTVPQSVIASDPDTFQSGSGDSVLSYWNGADQGATRFITLPNYDAGAYATFSSYEYIFGKDETGTNLSTPNQKILTMPNMNVPLPNAVAVHGNSILAMAPEYANGKLNASLHSFGQFDLEFPNSHYRHILQASSVDSGDVLKVPCMIPVSNITYGGKTSGYVNNILATSKIYFSTLEWNGSEFTYGLYAFSLYPTGSGTSIGGVYETQEELFGKKVTAKEVRIYMEPIVSGQSFQFDLIGIDGNSISDSSGLNVFTEGTNVDAGETIAWYNPKIAPTPAIGFRITNLGTVTPFIHKVEIDPAQYGK